MSYKNLTKLKTKDSEFVFQEVFADNFVEEIKKLSELLDKYRYIAFDTEFPGVVFQTSIHNREAYYRQIKSNVDKLKLIQLGITICDEMGNRPSGISTWQFNLKFDLNNDKYSHESIALLTSSGIIFENLEAKGIPVELFGEYLVCSGLILNDSLHWISFHGIYDFAYLLKYATNLPLPETEMAFFDTLKLYFVNYYDIRVLVRNHDQFRGSLMKLGQELSLVRMGVQHQAGSDSLLTSEIYFKLKHEHLNIDALAFDRNVLFGFGAGIDDSDPVNYYINNNMNNFKPNAGGNGSNSNNYYDYNAYQQNMMSMQYNYVRNNSNNYYPMNNGYGVPFNNFGVFPVTGSNSSSSNSLIPGQIDENKKKFNSRGILEE